MRQNMNTDSAAYRFYAERLIRKHRRALQGQSERHRLAGRQRDRQLRRRQRRRLHPLPALPGKEIRHAGKPQQGMVPELLGPGPA
jgi:hypothetical protein